MILEKMLRSRGATLKHDKVTAFALQRCSINPSIQENENFLTPRSSAPWYLEFMLGQTWKIVIFRKIDPKIVRGNDHHWRLSELSVIASVTRLRDETTALLPRRRVLCCL